MADVPDVSNVLRPLFGRSSLPPVDPFGGRPRPRVGDRVAIDFGDAHDAHPEVEGTVTDVGPEHLRVDGVRFFYADMIDVDVL